MSASLNTTSPFEKFAGLPWNNSSEYPSIGSNEFTHDLKHFEELCQRLEKTIASIKSLFPGVIAGTLTAASPEAANVIQTLQTISEIEDQASILIGNLHTFVSCESCVDGSNAEAQRTLALLAQKRALLTTVMTPIRLFLKAAPKEIIDSYLDHPHTAAEAYALRRSRELADIRLSEGEETTLSRMRTHAIDSLDNLYSRIAGTLRCRVKSDDGGFTELGLAQAAAALRDSSESRRRAAWHAIQEAWKTHETSVAAILNGLAGWRIEECRMRSHTRPFGFLDGPIHGGAIRPETLEAMLESIRRRKEIGTRANRAMSQRLGKQRLDPWDLLADAPTVDPERESRRTFKEGLHLIREAFGTVDPSFADFVDTMEKNRWIEGRALPNKQQGAFCTRFPKSRSPRVYMTYMGSANDVRTLAHELGHAFHGWIMRDLPRVLHRYPMTLAETASIFAETVLGEYLLASTDPATTFAMSWQNASSASSFLVNIPARFSFEKSFYERRLVSAYCSPDELGHMTEAAWREWYGDSISSTERQFWMTKLHFSKSSVSFYNFPYSFGALFSLGIYARRNELGHRFLPMYVELLRDTGRMTAEELAKKHLGEDISRPEFWDKSLDVFESQVTRFESLMPAKNETRADRPITIGQAEAEKLS